VTSSRITRSFAFIDLCGFTAYMEEHGNDTAAAALGVLRAATRGACEEHGVRVAKWLGDGAMLVGTDDDQVIACALAIDRQVAATCVLPLRGGVCSGCVLLFEGDDYVGPAVNIAARLCDVAKPAQVLVADERDSPAGPSSHPFHAQVRGLSRRVRVHDVQHRQPAWQADRSCAPRDAAAC
jgi:adenylate cyclase